MYRRILIAADPSSEGWNALEEGAKLAVALNATTHLLVVATMPAEAIVTGALHLLPLEGEMAALHRAGLLALAELGSLATTEIVFAESMVAVVAAARNFGADLVVVGHRRQSFLERWWAGESGANLADNLNCPLLMVRGSADRQLPTGKATGARSTPLRLV
jgi:nucleotide-binding universal stress UspA family protein